jgi:polyisoprenyl-phosphate glycosyltransferase
VRVDALIPAHDEAPRIGAVLDAVLAAGCLRRVLVVDDGSTDATADVARAAGVEVLELRPNRGKGAAMLAGLGHLYRVALQPEAVCFLDADLTGLRPAHVCALVDPVARGGRLMASGMPDYRDGFTNWMQQGSLNLSGQRVIARRLLERVPARFWSGYGIEVVLNELCERMGDGTGAILVLDGLGATTQREKRGDREGVARTWRILREALWTLNSVRGEKL